MKKFILLLTLVLTCLSLLTATAEARRFGGGSSFGKQRTMTPQAPRAAPTAAPAQGAAAPARPGSKWLGPLAGLAIGAGLGAMFAGGMGGLGGAMGSILMVLLAAAAVMMVISMLRKKQQPMQYAGMPVGQTGMPYQQPVEQQYAGGSAAASTAGHIPADFPVESFLRSAKTSFIRLQAANDRKDLNDIREYTTPEMLAEITMQLQERDNTPQTTSVISLNGELLEVVNEGDWAIASVRFTGQLSENNGLAESVDEIWHVQKNLKDDKSVWMLSGIQQTVLH